nr:DNA polymerase II [Raoultella sp. NCTC 9187]
MLGPEPAAAPAVDFQLEYVASRPQLLEKLNAWFAAHDPDILIGWNVVQFDLRVCKNTPSATVFRCCSGRATASWSGASTVLKMAYSSPRPAGG